MDSTAHHAELGWAAVQKLSPTTLILLVLLVIACATAVSFASSIWNWLRIRKGLASVPLAPGGLPIVGHVLPLLFTCPWEQMRAWAKASPPVVKIRIMQRQIVVIGTPEAMKRVFQTKQRVFAKDLGWSYYPFLPILGTGLVTAEGALWQSQRVLIGPALRLHILDDVMGIAKNAVDRLTVKLEGFRGTGRSIDMEEEFRLLALQVIGEAVLSLPPEECNKVFPDLYLPVMEESNKRVLQPWRHFLPIPAFFEYNSKMRQLNSYLIGIIHGRWILRKQGKVQAKPDILDGILEAFQASGDEWTSATETQLCFEVKTFLLAGHETSAAMLSWTMFELSQNPACLAQMRKEAETVFADESKPPEREDVEGMLYTHSALKESLRKYSVVPVTVRMVTQDDEICGYAIPRGTYVVCSLQAVHFLYKDPDAWLPERYMPGGEYDQFDESIRPYMFLPFIQGPRNCLGQYFAMLEARVVMGLLLKRFTFTPVRADAGDKDKWIIPVKSAHGMEMLIE